MRRVLLTGLITLASFALAPGSWAAATDGAASNRRAPRQGAASSLHDHGAPHSDGQDVPEGWRRDSSGLIVPGAHERTIAESVLLQERIYLPGRAPRVPPGAHVVTLDEVRTGGKAEHVSQLTVVHAPGDPSKLDVVKGSGSKGAVARVLEAHGNFEEMRAYSGKAATVENGDRSVPASMRARAVDLMPAGAKRLVAAYVEPPPPKDMKERVMRVVDQFFLTGNTPGVARAVRIEGGPPVEDRVANQVYDNSGTVYAFYRAALGRLSIDDKGMPIVSIVHQRAMDENGEFGPLNNAYYKNDDRAMRYGDGDQKARSGYTALDIAGHELTHGVTAHTAELKYRGQPGALNESFSDVLGMSIRQWKQGVTVDKADWRLAPDSVALTAPATVGAIRSMSDPHSVRGQPAHISEFKVMEEDSGGVHTNSGIPNRAFYGAAVRIGGFVWEKSAKIWYVTLRDYLRSDATFQDAARLTVHVAGQLYGEGSREQLGVIGGWSDVGIHVKASDPLPPPRENKLPPAPKQAAEPPSVPAPPSAPAPPSGPSRSRPAPGSPPKSAPPPAAPPRAPKG